jgi:hypothetical protein
VEPQSITNRTEKCFIIIKKFLYDCTRSSK